MARKKVDPTELPLHHPDREHKTPPTKEQQEWIDAVRKDIKYCYKYDKERAIALYCFWVGDTPETKKWSDEKLTLQEALDKYPLKHYYWRHFSRRP